MPKLTLVSRLQALLHQGRLKILRELDEAETLIRELQDFRMEFTTAGHLTFNARCGKHDDLVLALAIAVWRAYGGGNAGWVFLEVMRLRNMGSTACEPRYYVGVDLGQARDPTAIAVVRRVEPPGLIAEDDFGLKPKLTYARGSVEWEAEQRRLKNNTAPE